MLNEMPASNTFFFFIFLKGHYQKLKMVIMKIGNYQKLQIISYILRNRQNLQLMIM